VSDQAPEPDEPVEPDPAPKIVVVRQVDIFGSPTEHVVTDDEQIAWQWGWRTWHPEPPNIPPKRPWTRTI
jgi:hypothetical protein